MRIGLIADPWIPVPPPGYGGTESVIDCLARGLHSRGHDVRLFTVGTSTCPVQREWLYPEAIAPMGAAVPEAAHLLAAYAELRGADVIHDHTVLGPLFLARGADASTAVVATFHGPFTDDALRLYAAVPHRVGLICISHHQRATAGDLPVAAVIHHGVDIELYRPDRAGRVHGDGYLLFVGRMTADKGPDRAIRIARSAGRPVVLVAKAWEPQELAYFTERVQPLLGPDVTVADEPTLTERIHLVQHADALVLPIQWPEPFGLVMAEALACGTPVLAFAQGAAPEIVDDGITGFLGEDERALVAATARIGEIDRRACRRAARARFSMQRMTLDHELLYARRRQTRELPGPPARQVTGRPGQGPTGAGLPAAV